MKRRKWIVYVSALAMLLVVSAQPAAAVGQASCDVSDIALTPGGDATRLNITWHAGNAVAGTPCTAEVTKNLFSSETFTGTWLEAADNEDGEPECYCKVTVTGLQSMKDYTYRLADGNGDLSEAYEYSPGGHLKYGFLFVADPQIGASGGGTLSKSREGKPFIEDWYDPDIGNNDLPDDDTIETYLEEENPYDPAETELYSDYDGWEDYIDGLLDEVKEDVVGYIYKPVFYDEFKAEGMETDFSEVARLDPDLAAGLLALVQEKIAEKLTAVVEDAEGWSATVGLMTDMFPDAAFIISGGDQVEEADDEFEYTGLFTPAQLKSIPVAPTYASHDRALNFEYHFSLPNESQEYGQDSRGVGDYYFTQGNTLIMVLNMDVTNRLFPRGGPPGPPPGSGGGGSSTDTDEDGVDDDDDLCPDTYGESLYGCPMTEDYDDDEDGVTNDSDLCGNTVTAHYEAGLISEFDGCPVDDIDDDGIPDVDADGVTIDRCSNTYGDLTVDENGCADCDYLETDDELQTWLAELQYSCEEDDDTGEIICEDTLEDFKASLAEHEAFMTETIAANPDAKWKIVVWHYSIYSAAMHSTDDQSEGIRYLFTPILDNLDIDVVLMGHDHAYTRTYQMLGNEPQLDQTVNRRGEVVNPTGVLYLTASSSSGSKYYNLDCNIEDASSDSYVYYDYAAMFAERMPTFTYFDVTPNTLELTTYTYDLDEDGGLIEGSTAQLDEYAIQKRSRNSGR